MEGLAARWGKVTKAPSLIAERENRVFDTTLTQGRAALRLHRAGYQSRDAIEAELTWTEALAEAGFPCPRPWRTSDGDLVAHHDDGRFASMVTWASGTPLSDLPATPTNFERLGALLADLHEATDKLSLPKLERPAWDAPAFSSETPHWGRYWDNPALGESERALLQDARAFVADYLNALERPDFGLIHADVLGENVLIDGEQLNLIDFDDAGYGYRIYDLGTAMIQYSERSDLSAALRKGYEKRASVSNDTLSVFVLMRALASCGWIISRAPADDPRQAFYAQRAVEMARRVL